ncbi:MAG: TrkH family potassium uptake protein [Thiotrichales bacterium]
MHFRVIQSVLGIMLILFSVTLLVPAGVGVLLDDPTVEPFVRGFWILLLVGLGLWLPVRRQSSELRLRDGFLVVVSCWTVVGLAGSLPLLFSPEAGLTLTDAVFESFSGLTTTGATVMIGLDELPRSILFYRQQLQWLGGMGIILLAVAILPMLGIGGMQLYRAETPGPVKDNKLTPRIAETAKTLWLIYIGLTIACALAYYAAGMSFFDAVGHSFSTVSIGGFSTHDASIGFFESATIEMVAVFFMLISAANFGLHFVAWRRKSLLPYWRDAEFVGYVSLIALIASITVGYLMYTRTFGDWFSAFHHGLFQTVSIATTTGFTTAEYFNWPGFLPTLLLFASFVGGCAGSTGGGIKVVRVLLLLKQGARELQRLVHPSAFFAVKIGRKALDERVIEAVWGFFSAYVAVFVLIMLFLMATGLDQVTAFSATAATMNNLGPGLGDVGANFANVNDPAKWALCLAMLMGRLEVFTVLVLFTPTFWRH